MRRTLEFPSIAAARRAFLSGDAPLPESLLEYPEHASRHREDIARRLDEINDLLFTLRGLRAARLDQYVAAGVIASWQAGNGNIRIGIPPVHSSGVTLYCKHSEGSAAIMLPDGQEVSAPLPFIRLARTRMGFTTPADWRISTGLFLYRAPGKAADITELNRNGGSYRRALIDALMVEIGAVLAGTTESEAPARRARVKHAAPVERADNGMPLTVDQDLRRVRASLEEWSSGGGLISDSGVKRKVIMDWEKPRKANTVHVDVRLQLGCSLDVADELIATLQELFGLED